MPANGVQQQDCYIFNTWTTTIENNSSNNISILDELNASELFPTCGTLCTNLCKYLSSIVLVAYCIYAVILISRLPAYSINNNNITM